MGKPRKFNSDAEKQAYYRKVKAERFQRMAELYPGMRELLSRVRKTGLVDELASDAETLRVVTEVFSRPGLYGRGDTIVRWTKQGLSELSPRKDLEDNDAQT